MNNLLFIALIIAGIVFYAYQQKPLTKSTNNKATQTIPLDDSELEKELDKLIQNIRKLNQEI
jgi:ACT domain-containing protein